MSSSLLFGSNDEPKPSLRQSGYSVQLGLTGYNDRGAYYKAADEARLAAEEFGRARRNRDLTKMHDVANDKKEMLAMHQYANKMSKSIKMLRDQQDSIRLSDDYTIKEKRLKLKEFEAQESKLYDQFLAAFKIKKENMKARTAN